METAVSKKKRPLGFYVCAIGFTFSNISWQSGLPLMPLEAAWDLQMQMPPLWLHSSWPSLRPVLPSVDRSGIPSDVHR